MINQKQRWILFWVFVGAFTLLTLMTIWGVFIGFTNLEASHKNTLFSIFIVEIAAAVILLFKFGFELDPRSNIEKQIWLNFGDGVDARIFIKKQAQCSPRAKDGTPTGEDISSVILVDQGLFIAPKLPKDTEFIFVTAEVDGEIFEGSLTLGSYVVRLDYSKEEVQN